MNHKEKLEKLGFTLPKPLPSAGDYVGFVKTELGVGTALVSISGQVPVENGKLVCGRVGEDMTEDDAFRAAQLCALAILAQVNLACDDNLDRVLRCVRLGGFVNSVAGFTNHPEVINGASQLIRQVFGDRGKHARFAVGASSLPRNVAVEIEAQFHIET